MIEIKPISELMDERYTFIKIDGQTYEIPKKAIDAIYKEDIIFLGQCASYEVDAISEMKETDPDWEKNLKDFYYEFGNEINLYQEKSMKNLGEIALANLKIRQLKRKINDKVKGEQQSSEEVIMDEIAYRWIVEVNCSESDDTKLYRYMGTVEDVKKQLLYLIEEDKEKDESEWKSGTKSINEIPDTSDGKGISFYGYASYADFAIDYTAIRLSDIEELNDRE